jgi:branched-chain amino acid transport system permease protein
MSALAGRVTMMRRSESLASRRRGLEAIVAAVALVLLYTLWVGDDPYRLSLLVLGLAYAFLGIGIYVPMVLGARLSVCYNAYFAAGAYAVGLVATRTDLPIVLSIPIGMAAAALIAGVVGFACAGLSGYHVAVATIAVAHVSDRVLVDQEKLTGGSTGIGGIPPLDLFGYEVSVETLTVAGIVVVWLAAVVANRLRDSVWGFALRLQRDAPVAVDSCGASVESVRIVALAIGAAIASLGGILLAFVNQFIIPESFGFLIVFTVIFVPVLGGAASAWGSLIGAGLVIWLNNTQSFSDASAALIFGTGTLLVLVLVPGGILGMIYALGGVRRLLARASDGGR